MNPSVDFCLRLVDLAGNDRRSIFSRCNLARLPRQGASVCNWQTFDEDVERVVKVVASVLNFNRKPLSLISDLEKLGGSNKSDELTEGKSKQE